MPLNFHPPVLHTPLRGGGVKISYLLGFLSSLKRQEKCQRGLFWRVLASGKRTGGSRRWVPFALGM